MDNKKLHMVAFLLLIIGGLNWGLEAFGWGIGSFVGSGVAKIIYILVGLAAIYELATHKRNCRDCGVKKEAAPSSPPDMPAGQ